MANFDYFMILADRRTGSNFLESNINAVTGLTCHGEAFNPNFIGYPNKDDILGLTQKHRDADPSALIARLRQAEGLNGFRFFPSHDARILEDALNDPRCAKVVLTRSPIDSFVSLEIARATNQWKLTNVKRRRTEVITFKKTAFEKHLTQLRGFQDKVEGVLKRAGQTAFRIDFDDLQSLDALNGLVTFLGAPSRLQALETSLQRQNPESLQQKVSNFDEMQAILGDYGLLNATQGPVQDQDVSQYMAAPKSPALFMPIPAGPTQSVAGWMAGLDDAGMDELRVGYTPSSLRAWKQGHVGHRSFTVVRHPVARAFAAFCDHVLNGQSAADQAFRAALSIDPDAAVNGGDLGAAFVRCLGAVKTARESQSLGNEQPHWMPQTEVLRAYGATGAPDMVLREDSLQDDLGILAALVGQDEMPAIGETNPHGPDLMQVHDAQIEAAVRDIYLDDYIEFGFGPYRD